ncbi:MAG: 4-hydroxythreonine-4-phosphate dehydrogenase PdxA [Verrucomicrobiales bacterium]|jgi:4-hydroxythreonine-4-phosphate dehydrogenase|nr:4-hydroxythreonine-4-phosphate dehydrogenase PdxA [Verrucomicrobiales bacterium]
MQPLPVIGLTVGDPCGIGPEIIAKALTVFRPSRHRVSVRVIGSAAGFTPGKLSQRSASAALAALHESARLLRNGEIQAVVNAPVCKENLARVGFNFPGQTEFYARAGGLADGDVTMTMQSPKLRVALVSTHCSLSAAIKLLTPARIVTHAERTLTLLRKIGVARPRLAVCGLNPHAGEGGLFGDEEQKIVLPAVRHLRKKRGATVSGPWPADTVFNAAVAGQFDAVLCLYHDQGLIPFKLLAFAEGVNLTLGLPFWRASPDHGTAAELAGKNLASADSLLAALTLTARLLTK